MNQQLPEEAGYRRVSETGYFVVQKVTLPCPRCGGPSPLSFPKPQGEPSFSRLFGDESMFNIQSSSKLYYLYAFVDIGYEPHEVFMTALREAKAAIWPERSPDDWHLHVKDLRDERWRRKYPGLAGINEINQSLTRLIETFNQYEDMRRIIVVLNSGEIPDKFTKKQKKIKRNYIRNHLFSNFMRILTYAFTREAVSLEVTLEAQDNDSGDQMDSYVEIVGRSLRTELKYMYSTHGIYVGLPRTLRKGTSSSPGLEYADLVAYFIRRYLENTLLSKPVAIAPEKFGEIQWMVMTGGKMKSIRKVGFDWKYFYN